MGRQRGKGRRNSSKDLPRSVQRAEVPDVEPIRRVIVLGSGADADYGLPTMASLMHELARFAREDGGPIDKAIRKKLPYLRFSFDKFAGDRGDDMVMQLFAGGGDIAPRLRSAAEKLKADTALGTVGTMIEQLCDMATNNQLSGESLQGIAKLAGEVGDIGGAEPLLDPQKLTLSPVAGAALRRGFQQVLRRGTTLSVEERDTLELFVVATSNIEQLLSIYFLRYQDGPAPDKKTYLYLAWMLWAFLRVRSSGLGPREDSIYARLPRIGADVITFNYTNFFDPSMLGRVKFFHGRLDEYLRLDSRDVVRADSALKAATNPNRIAEFVDGLRLDVKADPSIDIPAIVPPTSFKPVMSRDQLRTWVEADDLLQRAGVVVVVGYSFGAADEHFNDLLRKTPPRTRILIVNPDLDHAARVGCELLGIDPNRLAAARADKFDLVRAERLTCVRARATNVTSEFLDAVLRP
jgi:hypothetical protein